MSLARVALLVRQRPVASLISHRNASSSAHDSHHEDPTEHYPREEFSGSFWRNTVFAALLVAAAYKYAPEPTNDTYLTRWIALYYTPRDRLLDLAVKHTAMSADNSETAVLLSSARQPLVHRYRYPQSFEKSSAFLLPVGDTVDTSKFVVKGAND
ncbi:hypothetical protein E4T56_gene10715 [Termitomyces sp. T112]|nr:hypothetical protein E4T56_gene10715 [Termitomyces sp. T112]KAH0589347.1 hypothetical protein H2248_005105 [Termitomyces sp. 'cryptogamus']KNZ80439.1 hypothetical protein J132_05559 [Termitomyces sp. J132]